MDCKCTIGIDVAKGRGQRKTSDTFLFSLLYDEDDLDD